MLHKDFSEECFHFGRAGEQKWMKYSLQQKRTLVEVGALREKLGNGAPMIYLPEIRQGKDKMISPDFLSINTKAMLNGTKPTWMDKNFVWTIENMWEYPFLWNEVKSKNGCTWSKKLQCWQTGIDGYMLRHYLRIQVETTIAVILFFLQLSDKTVQIDAPRYAGICPTGIYACPVSMRPDATWHPYHGYNCSVEHAKMAYWNIDNLLYIGSLEELGTTPEITRQVTTQLPLFDGIERAKQGYDSKGRPRA